MFYSNSAYSLLKANAPAVITPAGFDVNSFIFDGVDDRIDSTSAFTEFSNITSYSISFWVKLNTLGIEQRAYIIQDNAGSYLCYCLIRTTGRVDVGTMGNSSNWSRSTTNLTAGSWYHICIVLRDYGSRYTAQRIYINGVYGNTSNYFGGAITTAGALSIGQSHNGLYTTNGLYSDFSLWANHNLTDPEIAEIYNNGVPNNLNNINTPPTSWYRPVNANFNGTNWALADEMQTSPSLLSRNMGANARSGDVPT